MRMKICVIGGGAWGKALAHVAQSANNAVSIWSRQFPDPHTVINADAILVAVPAQKVREVLRELIFVPSPILIIAAKGIERGTGLLMADVAREVIPDANVMVLSGPSFAQDVINGLPTAITLAADEVRDARLWADVLSLPTFRIYHTTDVRGVEIGGALKNVFAIACGIVHGKELGDSAQAAIATRGLAELARLGKRLGARTETIMGLSGLGDLILTCSSLQSRNYSFGVAIGKGATPQQALSVANGVVEGAATAAIAAELASRYGIEMPITEAVHGIVDRGQAPDDLINQLLSRPATTE